MVELPAEAGKRRQEWSRQYPSRDRAEAALNERLVEVQGGVGVRLERGTLGEYLMTWLAGRRGLRESSERLYRRQIERHIVPLIGSLPLSEVRDVDIEACYARLEAGALGPAGLAGVDQVLRSAFRMALVRGMVRRDPMLTVERPRPERVERPVWTPEQARRFLRACDGDEWEPFFRLALATGMRRGELLALRWSDVDLERGWVVVRRTVAVDRAGVRVVNPPKSASGRRTIRIGPRVVRSLKAQRRQVLALRLAAGPDWAGNELVFPGERGAALNLTAPYHALRRLIGRANDGVVDDERLPVLRLHDLRHTAATLLILGGVPLKTVSVMLGHSTIAMTADRYGHVLEMMQDAAAQAMEGLLDEPDDDEATGLLSV